MTTRITTTARTELRAEMQTRGITQQDIAKHAGVTSTEISLVLSGQRNNQRVFIALATLVPDWATRWLEQAPVYRVRGSGE